MIQTRERRPGGGGVQLLGGELDLQYLKALRAAIGDTVTALMSALEPDPFDGKRPFLGLNCSNPAAFVGRPPIWERTE